MEGKWIQTHCARFDHGGCGLKVLLENGRITRVLPDATNPRSKGYACAKGMASLERIYHPQRLVFPMIRRGKRGEADWEKITWDEALAYAVKRLNEIKEKAGPQAVAFAQGAPKGVEYLLMMRLANLFRSPNLAGTQHVCHMPRELMGRITCGFLPVPDYENPTKCILVWGSNPYHTNEEGVLGIHLKRRLMKSNPKLIVIDPCKTEIAKDADLWLQIKPGTDDLLALGFLRIIIDERLYDEDFVKEWTTGFDELQDHIQQYTVKMVSDETMIPEEQIYQAARFYAESRPAIINWGNAIENNSNNTSQTARALIILMAITGNLDVPGGNIQATVPPVKSLRNFVAIDHFPEKREKSISRYYGISPLLPLVPGSLLIKTILDEKPYPIKALFISGSNPLLSYPGANKVFQALQKLEFIMVSDIFMTPTAALADLVLPAATNMEYNDIGHYGLPHGYVLARPKIVESQGECWSDIKIINELGKRLGFEDFFWENIDDCIEEILEPSGMSYDEFCQKGILTGEKRYYKYKKQGFRTPSGKVEIYSSILKKSGYHPLPTAKILNESDENYPLIMINRKPKSFFHSSYRNISSLRKKHGKPSIKIHSETALKYGIGDDDRVAVMSPYGGPIYLHAVISQSIHPAVVMVDYGWWFPEEEENQLFSWQVSNINILTSGDYPYDPVLGSIPLRNIPCKIEKC